MDLNTQFQSTLVATMNNHRTQTGSIRRGRRLSELTFGESRSHFKTNSKKLVEKTETHFPSLGNCKENTNETIKYSVKDLFANRKKNKKKKNLIAPGWVRLYFKNCKICREYGPAPLIPPPDYTNYFQQEVIRKYLLRLEEYESLQDDEFILPHVKEFIITDEELDYYPSDNDSDDEYYSDDDEFLSDY